MKGQASFQEWMSGFVRPAFNDTDERDVLASRYIRCFLVSKKAQEIIKKNRTGYLCGWGIDRFGDNPRYFHAKEAPDWVDFVFDLDDRRVVDGGFYNHDPRMNWPCRNLR